MLFLRFTVFLIIALGVLIYLISTKIRSEFKNTGGRIVPQFRGSSAEFEAFCKNPPTENASKLLKLKKKLSISLIVAVFVFLLSIVLAILEQT